MSWSISQRRVKPPRVVKPPLLCFLQGIRNRKLQRDPCFHYLNGYHLEYWVNRKCWYEDRKSTRLNSSHGYISYAVFCLKKKKKKKYNLTDIQKYQNQNVAPHKTQQPILTSST